MRVIVGEEGQSGSCARRFLWPFKQMLGTDTMNADVRAVRAWKQCLCITVLRSSEALEIRLEKECFRSKKDFTASGVQFLLKGRGGSHEEGVEVDPERSPFRIRSQ